MPLSDDEFDAFVADCCRELETKQSHLAEQYGLGHYPKWWYDQTNGTLEFRDVNDVPQVVTTYTDIGSFSPSAGTWRWAWANATIVESQRRKSLRLRQLAEITGMDIFDRDVFNADPEMPWELASMAVKHLAALGCYRMPGTSGLLIFVALDAIEDRRPGRRQ